MVQKGAKTKARANKIKSSFKKQGYKLVTVMENPPSLVGKHKIPKYTVVAKDKRKK